MTTYEIYSKDNTEVPYSRWVIRLRDKKAERKLDQALKKVTLGNTSHVKRTKTNPAIFEITIDFGPGYRIYCTWVGKKHFLVLWAGDKDTQQKDIERAEEYLEDYKARCPQEKSQ